MKSAKHVIFKTKGELREDEVELSGGIKIIIATHLTEIQRSVMNTDGIVIDAPKGSNLLPGDKIYFGKNTIDDAFRIDPIEHIYWCDPQHIILCERNGELIMMNNYVLVEKLEQNVSKIGSLFIPDTAKKEEFNIGTIKYGNNSGALVYYHKWVLDGLTINVNGVDYLRFDEKYILANIIEKDIDTKEGFIVVKLVDEENKTANGIILKTEAKEVKAVVLTEGDGLAIGDKVMFYRRALGTKTKCGNYLMREDDICLKI